MHPFRAAVEAKDLEAALALFAPDATLDSPVSFKPFVGIDVIRMVLGAVSQTFEDFEYTDEFEQTGAHVLVFEARVGDKAVQGIDLIRTDSEGRIVNLTVMVRPLSGLIALAEAMSAKIGQLAK
jgi:ketosteroid isomerase-like protein